MAKNKVSAPSTGKQGGSAGTTAKVVQTINNALSGTKGKLDTKESKFISNMITQAAKTGKGISNAELEVIKREALKQASKTDKAGVAAYKTANVGKYIEDYKLKLSKESNATVDTGIPGTGSITIDTSYTGLDSTPSIKIPNKDNVLSLNKDNYDVAQITSLVFEKLGAVELTKFTRSETVEGNNRYYNVISNLSSIRKEFDPSNLVSSQKSDDSLFNAFSIKLQNKIPGDIYLQNRNLDNFIYIDTDGNLVIELDNMTQDELVEIEIDTNGTIVEVR